MQRTHGRNSNRTLPTQTPHHLDRRRVLRTTNRVISTEAQRSAETPVAETPVFASASQPSPANEELVILSIAKDLLLACVASARSFAAAAIYLTSEEKRVYEE